MDPHKEVVEFDHQPGLEVSTKEMQAYHGASHGYPQWTSPGEKTILGLRKTTFFLSVALAAVVVIAAVGAGVGATVAVNNARSSATGGMTTYTVTQTVTPSASANATASSTGPITVPTDAILDFDCASLSQDQSVTLGTSGGPTWTFQVQCLGDYVGNKIDIASPTVYSFHDCLQACATYNYYTGNNTGCVAVEFNANLSAVVPAHYGNCFLKAYSAPLGTGIGSLAAAATLVSAPT